MFEDVHTQLESTPCPDGAIHFRVLDAGGMRWLEASLLGDPDPSKELTGRLVVTRSGDDRIRRARFTSGSISIDLAGRPSIAC